MANFTPVTQVGSFTGSSRDLINANFQALFNLTFTPGNVIWLAPASGTALDSNDGSTPAKAKATLSGAYAAAVDGNNDVIALISDGTTASTARVNAAFTWAKNATHLVGISSGVNISNRSRIAPTGSTTAFANFFTVSGSGCQFNNIQWFHGFDTGTTSAICLTVTGGRNLFVNCHIAGMGDAASAQNSGSRSLKISGSTGENGFVNCAIGIDTVTRTTSNASVEFASATPRNQFIGCVFPFMTSNAGVLGITAAASGSMDRFQYFKDCLFTNAIGSTSTAMTALTTLGASTGGLLVLKSCTAVGITDLFSDATTAGQMRIDGGAPTANATGLAVQPT